MWAWGHFQDFTGGSRTWWWHVMSCDVMSCDIRWCHGNRTNNQTKCDVTWAIVMSSVMSLEQLWCHQWCHSSNCDVIGHQRAVLTVMSSVMSLEQSWCHRSSGQFDFSRFFSDHTVRTTITRRRANFGLNRGGGADVYSRQTEKRKGNCDVISDVTRAIAMSPVIRAVWFFAIFFGPRGPRDDNTPPCEFRARSGRRGRRL